MLADGYSAKKIEQTLPDEIKVCRPIIYKVDKFATYDEYCGIAKKPVPQPDMKAVLTHVQTVDIIKEIGATNERLDRLCALVEELVNLLK
jgi:hypothetical protein